MEPWGPPTLEIRGRAQRRGDRRSGSGKGRGNQQHLFHRGGSEQLVKEEED